MVRTAGAATSGLWRRCPTIPAGTLPGDVDPESGEESTRAHDEGVVEQRMEGVGLDLKEAPWGHHVVGQSANGRGLTVHVVFSPAAEEADKVVALVLSVEDGREEVEVGHEGALQDDRDVGGVEQFDGVGHFVPAHLSVGER